MYDKEKLGNRYTCFQCGTKFYDLNRPEPLCPECNADQREAPVRDVRALLASGRRGAAAAKDDEPSIDGNDDEDEGDEFDDDAFSDDDDDDDDDGDDD